MREFTEPLGKLAERLESLTMDIGARALVNRDEVGAAATDYLRIMGHFALAYFWARMVQISLPQADKDAFYAAKLSTGRFYFKRLLPEVEASFQCAGAGAACLFELDADAF
jgi:hypothetical protein